VYRVPSERITLDLDGPSVEIERLSAWAIQFEGLQLAKAFLDARGPAQEYTALVRLFDYFAAEAMPSWDIVDHRGPVPATARGMLRLPLSHSLALVNAWIQSLPAAKEEEEPQSAVDAVLPPGALNREVKRRLRAVKKAA
jgi:hypothetical protein